MIHGALGLALLLCPRRLVSIPGGSRARTLVIVARVLGGRHLAEAAMLSRDPDASPPEWSIAVDGLHGFSMLALARFRARSRRDALTSAGVAFSVAALAAYER